VKTTDFPTPNPTTISEISPSLANQLLACQLRVGFTRDPEHKSWKRQSTYTALGLVAHAVIEAVFKNRHWPDDPTAFRELLQKLWDEETERGVTGLAKDWSPVVPPPPAEWPGYMLTRSRIIRRAMQLRTASPVQRSKSESDPSIEIGLRDPESGLSGRPDRIESNGKSTRVVDLKTGLHQKEPTEEQRRQLLLYAVLVHRTTGKWPTSIAVEDTSGRCYNEPLDSGEAEAALEEVLAAVASFNKAITTRTLVAEANPNPERCRWCDFRVLCRPFWEALTSEWSQGSAFGSVTKAGDSQAGAFVSFVVESPQDQAGTMVHISGLSQSLPVDTEKVATTDWTGTPEAGGGRARWATIVRTW